FRLDTQTLDHLHQERWMSTVFEISGVEGEVGNHESTLLIRPRNSLPDQKPPGVAAIGVGEAKRVGKVGEAIEADVRQLTRAFDAVMDVLPPQPSIESRDAARIVQLEEMGGNI